MPYHLPESNDFNTKFACIRVPIDKYHRAAFIGQIEYLAHWYAWDRDAARSGKEAAAVWQNIIEELTIGDRCDPIACPNGIILEIDPDDPLNQSGTIHDVRTYNCPSGEVDVYFIRAFGDLFNHAHLGFRLMKDGLNIGGYIPQVLAMTFDVTPGNSFTFNWRDCFNQLWSETTAQGADQYQKIGFVAKKFLIDANDSFMAVVTIPHEVDCSPA